MNRNKIGSNWIVQKWIERDHVNSHYRRLQSARSHLQLNNRNEPIHGRLSKSNHDLRFEERVHSAQSQRSGSFCLNVTSPATDRKKRDMADESLDVLAKHSKYFTQPKQQFTPRLVRKIVRPSSSPPKKQAPVAGQRTAVAAARTIKSAEVGSAKKEYDSSNQRNVSDDSAFGDEQSIESDASSDDSGTFDFKKWLKEQEEENSYVQLLCDITADLLQRHLCTNGDMKQIISTYIRRTRKKFSMNANALMERLCDDLLIPSDDSFDDHYYGSRTSGAQVFQNRNHGEFLRSYDYRLRGIEPSRMANNYCSSSVDFNSEEAVFRPTSNRRESQTDPSSILKRTGFNFNSDGRIVRDEANVIKSVGFEMGMSSLQDPENDAGGVPDNNNDGYCSDFTNDTENDIEEELDCD